MEKYMLHSSKGLFSNAFLPWKSPYFTERFAVQMKNKLALICF